MIALAASVPAEHPPFFSIRLYFFKMATNCIDTDNLHQTPVSVLQRKISTTPRGIQKVWDMSSLNRLSSSSLKGIASFCVFFF